MLLSTGEGRTENKTLLPDPETSGLTVKRPVCHLPPAMVRPVQHSDQDLVNKNQEESF